MLAFTKGYYHVLSLRVLLQTQCSQTRHILRESFVFDSFNTTKRGSLLAKCITHALFYTLDQYNQWVTVSDVL